jgi:hypothetical protein
LWEQLVVMREQFVFVREQFVVLRQFLLTEARVDRGAGRVGVP